MQIKLGIENARMVYEQFVDYLYPPICALCASELAKEQEVDPVKSILSECLCPSCRELFLIISNATKPCAGCHEPAFGEDEFCLLCQVYPFETKFLWSAYAYVGVLKDLLRLYKYGSKRNLGVTLARLLIEKLRTSGLNLNNLLVIPLPSSKTSLRHRGFNHLGPFTRILSNFLDLEVSYFALRSNCDRPAQASLDPKARRSISSSAFIVRPQSVKSKEILLIDDIVTTGSSITAASLALKEAGASSVSAITLARSSQFVHHRVSAGLSKKQHLSPVQSR